MLCSSENGKHGFLSSTMMDKSKMLSTFDNKFKVDNKWLRIRIKILDSYMQKSCIWAHLMQKVAHYEPFIFPVFPIPQIQGM